MIMKFTINETTKREIDEHVIDENDMQSYRKSVDEYRRENNIDDDVSNEHVQCQLHNEMFMIIVDVERDVFDNVLMNVDELHEYDVTYLRRIRDDINDEIDAKLN